MVERDDIQQDLFVRRISGRPNLQVKDAIRYCQIDAARGRKRLRERQYAIATRRPLAKSIVDTIDDEELAHKIMEKIPKSDRQRYILERLGDGARQVTIALELGISPALLVSELKDIKRRSIRLIC